MKSSDKRIGHKPERQHEFCDLIDAINFRSTLTDVTAKVNSFDDLNKHTYSVIKPYVIKS